MKEKNLFKKKKEELEYSEEHIKDLFYFLPVPVFILGPEGIVINLNRLAEKLTGYDKKDLIGQTIGVLFKDKEVVRRLLRDSLKNIIARDENINLSMRNKKMIVANVSVVSKKDDRDGTVRYSLVISDISELRRLQEGLEVKVRERTKELEDSQKALMNMLEDTEESREKAEEEKDKTLTIINNFTDGLIVFDKKNKILLVNPLAEDFLKIKKEDIIGKSISKLPKILALSLPIKKPKGRLKKNFGKELKINKDLILNVSVVAIKRERKKLGSLLILHNITREKLVEKLKTEFVSLSAHQLRTPLSAIKWTLKMVLDGDLGKVNKDEREFLGDAYVSNERMINLVNDLLDVSRIEEGRYIFELVPTDIEEITEKTIIDHKKESDDKKIIVKFKRPKKKIPKIMLDKEKIQMVIDNLLRNAIKYTPKNGKIVISVKKGKKEVNFSIEDNGVGIPKDQQKRIFTKFFRATNIRKIDTTGSGLGLYITKNIVNAHHGKIWFISKEGKGTTFFFNLPFDTARVKALK